MAVVDRKSTALTNRDSSPRINNPPHISGGNQSVVRGTFELANGDSIASIFRMAQVPSGAIIDEITLFCDAITSAAGDVGLYQTTDNGGAVVAVGCYATAQSIASANTTGINVQFEAKDIANIEKRVFEDAGLTTDSQRMYDIALTLTAAAAAAGTLSFRIRYTTP